MATGSVGAFDPTTAQPFDPTTAQPVTPPAPNLKHLGKQVDKKVGGALVYGHNHPFDAFMAVMGAPQRALQAAEVGENPISAAMDPKARKHLQQELKQPLHAGPAAPLNPLFLMRQIGSGLGSLEAGPLAGKGLPQKATRGVLDTAYDIANDPTTYLPLGAVGRVASRLLPQLGKGAHTLADIVAASGVGKAFNPEHGLQHFTDYGKAAIEAIINRERQAEWVKKQSAIHTIAHYAQDIRNGQIPPEVAQLFASAKNIPAAAKGLTPQDIEHALNKELVGETWRNIQRELRNNGITAATKGHPAVVLRDPERIFKNPANLNEARAALKGFLKPGTVGKNVIFDTLQYLTHRGNQAFLAVPFPHMLNLINLSYNRYGVGTTLKGIGRAAQISTGLTGPKLMKDVSDLTGLGAHSQYANLFTEYGMNKLLGSRTAATAANKTIVVPFERFSNWLQQKFLNPMETGLRTAALGAERKAGTTDLEAARHIHQAFGTNPPNAVVRASRQLATPFAQFHVQTITSSGIRTLVNDPSRITNLVKAQLDMNAQVNPGKSPKFTPTVPGLSFARAVTEPEYYYPSVFGPLYSLGQAYSGLSQLQKGKVSGALSKALGRYIPMSQAGDVLMRLLTSQKGEAGQKPQADMLPVITGGYYSKPKP